MTPEQRLAVAFLATRPRLAARALESLPVELRAAALAELRPEQLAPALRELTAGPAAACLPHLPAEHAGALLSELTPDHAADLLRRVPAECAEAALAAMPHAAAVRRTLRYPEGTAGALMDPSVFHLPEDVTAADARTRLLGATRDVLYYLYVVDRERRLVGVLDVPELLQAPADDELSAVCHRNVERLPAWAPTSVVREHPGFRAYHALPVVDEADVLVGAIRYQTLRRLEALARGDATPPATTTALALGELYHVGLRGLLGSFASAASELRARGEGEDG